MQFEKVLIKEMKVIFGDDRKRIAHALNVTKHAKLLLKKERGSVDVVIPAAILHDIGILEAENKHGSSAGPYKEQEGPPIARNIMEQLDIDESTIDEVCNIIGNHHSPGKVDTLNFKILYDADWLVNLSDEYDCQDKEKLSRIINRIFLTDSGKIMARADMFTATEREEWITPEIEEGLQQAAKGGELSCYQAMEFAQSNKIPLKKMKYLTDLFKVRLKSCQLNCF